MRWPAQWLMQPLLDFSTGVKLNALAIRVAPWPWLKSWSLHFCDEVCAIKLMVVHAGILTNLFLLLTVEIHCTTNILSRVTSFFTSLKHGCETSLEHIPTSGGGSQKKGEFG